MSFHPTALVDSSAQIEPGVTIGPYCVVSENVKIGRGTVLRGFTRILPFVEIGQDCTFHGNTVIGGEPQDLDFGGEESWVKIGDRNIIRENVTINRGSGEGAYTTVGDDCLLMEGVHLAHNVEVGNNVTLANKTGLSGYCTVGDNSVLGGMAGLHQFVRIGRFCMVGGLSKVVKDIPPFLLVDGRPGKIYGTNSIGLKRGGFSPRERSGIKNVYKNIFQSGLPFRQSVEELKRDLNSDPFAEEILAFIEKSRRGIESWPSGSERKNKID